MRNSLEIMRTPDVTAEDMSRIETQILAQFTHETRSGSVLDTKLTNGARTIPSFSGSSWLPCVCLPGCAGGSGTVSAALETRMAQLA